MEGCEGGGMESAPVISRHLAVPQLGTPNSGIRALQRDVT